MKKLKKLIAVLMAAVLMLGTMSVAASAAYSPYLDSAITSQYNTIDKAELTTVQKSSLILDMLDVMLEKEQIYIDIPLIGEINLCSTDEALSSIYSLTGNFLYGRLTVGDLVVLETHRDKIASIRRTTADKTDLDLINSLVDYVAAVIPTLTGMLDGTMSWGIVKGFLPPEFRIIIDDFDKFLKEMLWDALHPVNDEAYPSTTTLDSLIQFMYDNQLGGQRPDVMGFEGVMPGFSVNLATDNAYRTIEEAIYCALNEFIVPVLNGDLKNTIRDAVESNTNNGGDLAALVNVDYVIESYNFDDSKGLIEQLNDVFKDVVDEMLNPGQFTWNATGTGDPVAVLKDNLERLLKTIIEAGGETEDVSSYTLEQLGDYIARVAVEQFVKHMDIESGATMERIAYEGLVELCASTIPEVSYADAEDITTTEGYRDAIIEIAADLGTFYLNNNIGLNCSMDTNADQFLAEFAEWCMQYVDGLFDPAVYNEATTGWGKIDGVLWEIIPKEWLPYDEMFRDADGTAGTASELGLKSLVDYILDAVFAFDLDALALIFEHNADCELSGSARQVVINFIRNILDGAFYTLDASGNKVPCIPAGKTIDEFEDILSDISILKDTVSNIFAAISTRKNVLVPTTINLVTMLMGAVDPQSLGDVELAIDSQIYCENGAVPSGQTLRISNYSDGLNRGWRQSGATEITQDKMYEIEIVSVSNDAGLTLAEIPEADKKIAANDYVDVAVSGTIDVTKEVRFDVSYYILDEYGNQLNSTALVKSVYANFSKEGYGCGGESAAIDSTNRVSFEAFDTHLHTTDAYDISLFSILATNNGVILGNAVRDIRRAVLKSGTLPAGITMNNPADGPIARIEEASFTTDSYGTVNPYSAETMDPDAEQPYGIYDVTIAFEICSEGANSGTQTDARAHELVIYNDFGLPGLLDSIMSANRQEVNYANASVEWAAYQTAVKDGYALLHGNVDHNKMFADVNNPDGSENDYAEAVADIEAAVAALDAKVKATNETLLAQLEAAVEAQAGVEREDYVLFTYDRWDDWYDHAAGLVNSQDVAEGETAPAISDFDLIYAKHMVNLMYGRLIKNTPVKTHLAAAIAKAEALNASDYSTESWAALQTALTAAKTVNNDTSAALLQTQVNSARVELMKAQRRLAAAEVSYITPAAGVVVDNTNMLIYGLTTGLTETSITSYFEPVSIYDMVVDGSSGTTCGTGSTVTIKAKNTENVVATYTIIIYGDVDGNGQIQEADMGIIDSNSLGTATGNNILVPGQAKFIAADLDKNGVINFDDSDIIYAHLNEGVIINQGSTN